MAGVQIEYMPLDSLTLWSGNPKEHDIARVKESIRTFGFISPVIMDETTEKIVAGNGRIEALREMLASGEDAPVNVREAGTWLIPVLRGVSFKDPQHAEAYLIADNRLNEIGGWNTELLTGILQEMQNADLLDVTGYDMDAMDDLLAQVGATQEIEPPKFEGGYIEDDAALQQRIANRAYDGVGREVVMILSADEHQEFLSLSEQLKQLWAATQTKEVVLKAMRQAVGRMAPV